MKLKLVLIFFVIQSCTDQVSTLIVDESLKAVGKISKDTIYDGVIRFYDLKTGKLSSYYNYKEGKRFGFAEEYFRDGKLAARMSFSDDRLNGFTTFYDQKGSLLSKEFYYYGLKAGSSQSYLHDRIAFYKFYSLDQDVLIDLDYELLKDKTITEAIGDFFFYRKRDYSNLKSRAFNTDRIEYFLYTPNPPLYTFNYSLVQIDSSYNVLSELQNFGNDKQWVVFNLPKKIDTQKILALKLTIQDSTNGNIRMFKVLKP